ncbi:MAG: TldD/PmbA family protein [Gemmatimonadaceae bacterium]|jgi:predicted Zn-dependent protease|nr:TldD/PmbA family protein [Gemmatimonadaceae bacterium]
MTTRADAHAPRGLLAGGVLARGDAESLVKRILGFSHADACRVSLGSRSRGNTRFAVNQVSTAGDTEDLSVVVRAVVGKKVGTATTNRLDDDALRRVVETAERIAKLQPDDPELMPELAPQSYLDVEAWDDATAAADPAARAALVAAVTERARRQGLVSTGYVEVESQATAIGNSAGLFAYHRATDVAMTTTVRTSDGAGSGWAGGAARRIAGLDADALGERAIDKARRSARAVAIEPGRYTVVLEPTAVGNLVQLMAFATGARNADEGRSFFSKPGGGTKIGMKVVDERVTLTSDPQHAEAPGSPFDGDGQPTRKVTWIGEGVVRDLAYDRYWASRKNVAPVVQPRCLQMQGGTQSLDEMIASTERGILVTRFWYIRPVDQRTILYTGLTRDGTFLIEKGKVTRAVKNLRFNESPVFLLNNLEALGRAARVSASESGSTGVPVVVPAVKARDFNFTSLSDAV